MKLPPYGRQLKVSPDIQFLLVFVGAPECWQHARAQIESGFHNFLCLPDADESPDYQWPVADSSVIVIIFGDISPETEATLLAVLCRYRPKEVILRHWPGSDLIVRSRRSP